MRSGAEMPCVLVKFFLDEAFKMFLIYFVPSGVEMPCVFRRVFLDQAFRMRVLGGFLRSPICGRVPRCLAFRRGFLMGRLRCIVFGWVFSFPPQPNLDGCRVDLSFVKFLLDETFRMKLFV